MLSLPAGFCAAAAFSSSKLQPKYRGSAAAHSPQHMAKPWQEQQQLPLPQLASQLQKQQQQPRGGSPGAGTGMSLWTAMTAVAGGSAAAAVGQYKKMVRRPWCLQHICTGCNTLCRKDAIRLCTKCLAYHDALRHTPLQFPTRSAAEVVFTVTCADGMLMHTNPGFQDIKPDCSLHGCSAACIACQELANAERIYQ